MDEFLRLRLEGKSLLLLGFGKEGEASFRIIRALFPDKHLLIADRNPAIREHELLRNDPFVTLYTGENYLFDPPPAELVIKSPGISLPGTGHRFNPGTITSQTDLFLQVYASQTVGITGTKGKSTTSSLIWHILSQAGHDAVLLGNIGTPAFHFTDKINPGTVLVDELSSHQLEYLSRSPHIAVILNLFEEHLDAYDSFEAYQHAKLNIARFQTAADYLIYSADNALVNQHVTSMSLPQKRWPFSVEKELPVGGFLKDHAWILRLPGMEERRFDAVHNRYLRGRHNQGNMLAAMMVTSLLGVSTDAILNGLDSFKGLSHRMEFVGIYHGVHWYNDSIATIPEACMAAVNAIPEVETLILGGFDRGVSYDALAGFLAGSGVKTFILTGNAGKRMGESLEKAIREDKTVLYIHRFDDFFPLALSHTRKGAACLLSPAASSYDEFRSFEERGFRYAGCITGKTGEIRTNE